MARGRRSFTDAELEGMAAHILYERRTWQWALEGLVPHSDPGPEHNALVEVYSLHSRTLTEFLACNPKQGRDDVVASDYADWMPGDDIGFLTAAIPSISKRFAHLSLYRLNKATAPDELERWRRNSHHLTVIWDQFLSVLTPERRTWFEKELSA